MNPYRLMIAALCVAATVPRLAHRGMFVDGLTYASIARNLAEGRGSFWSPSYTATLYPAFYEHPPLGFWLESLWFRVLGDHLFVERAYSLMAAALTLALIVLLWRRLERGSPSRHLEWMPVLLWIMVPVVSWTIVGNLLETTVAVFTTASVLGVVRALGSSRLRSSAAWGALSGLGIAAATLTKGPVGLFPLAAPIILFLFGAPSARRPGRAVLAIAMQWAVVAACAVAICWWPAAHDNVSRYLADQLLPSVTGRREVSDSSITIIVILVRDVLLPLAVGSGLFVLVARRWIPPDEAHRRRSLAFFTFALAATLPIALSPKQAGHYLVPAVPFYAISVASLLTTTANSAIERVKATRGDLIVLALTAVLMIGTLAASVLPILGRDRQRLADLDALAGVIPRGATVGVCAEDNGDWGLHAWLARLFEVSLDASGQTRSWFLANRLGHAPCAPPTCTPVSDASREVVLMQCR